MKSVIGMRCMVAGMLCLLGTAALATAPAADGAKPAAVVPPTGNGTLDVRFDGLRSAKGSLRACLTKHPQYFPKCDKDPAALSASVAAGPSARIVFRDVPPGDYALLVLHDENGNNKVDTMLGIPREGVGFSRNPRLMFGAPRFDAVRIAIPAGPISSQIKLQYFL